MFLYHYSTVCQGDGGTNYCSGTLALDAKINSGKDYAYFSKLLAEQIDKVAGSFIITSISLLSEECERDA